MNDHKFHHRNDISREQFAWPIYLLVLHDRFTYVDYMVPFNQHVLDLIPAWINNYILGEVRDERTSPFPKSNGAAVG